MGKNVAGLYVGIDPGKGGWTAEVCSGTGKLLRTDQQPLIGAGKGDTFDLGAMRERIKRWKREGVELVVLEELKPMGSGNKGIIAAWIQSAGYMAWKAELAALEVRCIPKTKAHMKKILGVQTPARIPKKPEPAPPKGKRPKKPGKKAPTEKTEEWKMSCAAWDKKKAEHDIKHKAWKTADRARLTRWRSNTKLEAIKVAQQYFPNVDFRRTPKCKNPDDGKCEAALYALLASKLDPKHAGVV